MKKIRKGWYFTIVLAVIALVELVVVLYDLLHPMKENEVPVTLEVVVPEQEFVVKPFVFEDNSTFNLTKKLEKMRNRLHNSLISRIAKDVAEPQATETAPHDEEIEKKLLNMSDNAPVVKPRGSVMLAVVIDDMGVSAQHTKNIISLAQPMTASFLTYGSANRQQVVDAKNNGFEVMLHAPMMPHVQDDLAPVTLSTEMDEFDIKNKLLQMISMYRGLGMKGVNNHMGSLFTEDAQSMDYVMQVLKAKNLYFLDSKTTSKSVAEAVAKKHGVPYIARDVFIDNENDYDYIMKQLARAEKIAHMRGYAVAIGHPRSQTYLALRDWVKGLRGRHVRLVHLGDLVREVNKKS